MADEWTLTTMDNPWNPFTQQRDWYAHDVHFGYNTYRWIAFLAKVSPKMEDEMYAKEGDYAANRLLELNPFGLHYKVYKSDADKVIPLANEAYNKSLSKQQNVS